MTDDFDIHQQFKAALQACGIIPPEQLIDDGRLHRCDVEGHPGRGDASYLLHNDGYPAGGWQNWTNGEGWQTWRADIDHELTGEELEELRQRAEDARQQREAEAAARHAEAAQKAAALWAAASACDAHPYLARKGVKPYGLRVTRDGDLAVPLRNADAVLTSLEFITANGSKKFLSGGRTRGCYHSLGDAPTDTILLGEGFATCGSSFEATGYPAAVAFDCGNLLSVAMALREKYPAARIVLLADDDYRTPGNPGLTKAREAAGAVGGVVAIPNFGTDRPDGATDFNDLARHAGLEAVRRCIDAAQAPAEPTVPASAQPEIREFPELVGEAFIGLSGEIVREIAPHTESDPAGLLLSVHTFFGNCIGRGPHYQVESTQHGTNLFLIKVGDSAKARKGTGEDRVLSLFRTVDYDWARFRTHSGLSSGEGVIWEVRDRTTKLVKDKKTGQVTQEVADPGIDDKRLLVIESEFAGALRVMQREGNILSRILRDAWDRGDLATLTKNSPARATGACISIIGHITATELRSYLDRTEMASGFANRFLFACVRRSQFLPFGGNLPEDKIEALAERVGQAVTAARTFDRVVMSDAARAEWAAIYGELSADRPGLLGSLTARAEAQVVRLAMIYALWDGTDCISIDHLTAAAAIEDFSRKSVEYVFGDSLGDQVADTLLAALRAAGSSGLTRTEISGLFSRNVSANQIARALGELSRRQLAAQRRGTTAGGGRPAEIWFPV